MGKSKKITIVFTVVFVLLVAIAIYIIIAMCEQIENLNVFFENIKNPSNTEQFKEVYGFYVKEKTAFITTITFSVINIFTYIYLWLNIVLKQKFTVLCNNLKLKGLLTFQNIKLILKEQKKIKKQEKIDKLKSELEKLNKE